MTEISFAKQFLTALDSRSLKLSSDHIADPRTYPAQSAYTLPRLPNPPHPLRPAKRAAPASSSAASSATLTITLKPFRSTSPSVTLQSQAPTTSIYDLKAAYAKDASVDINKIKVLWKKKPTVDSKTVAELIEDPSAKDAEFSIMLLPGAATSSPAQTPVSTPPVEVPPPVLPAGGSAGGSAAQGPSGTEMLRTEEFWGDLKGFLAQRLRDEAEGERLAGVFRGAWEGNKQ